MITVIRDRIGMIIISRIGMIIVNRKMDNTLDRVMNSWDSLRSTIEMIIILVVILLKRYSRILRKPISVHINNKIIIIIRYRVEWINQIIISLISVINHKTRFRNYNSRSNSYRSSYRSKIHNWWNSNRYYTVSSSSQYSSRW